MTSFTYSSYIEFFKLAIMWGLVQDYMSTLLGAFILLISIIFIPEIKKYRLKAIILCVILTALGVSKNYRDAAEKDKFEVRNKINDRMIVSLDSTTKIIAEGRKQDSLKFKEFADTLKAKFHIIRDSTNNLPRLINYNTHINKAETVNIGR